MGLAVFFMFDNVGQLVYNEDMVEKGGVSSMTEHIKLPVGVDSFEKIRREGFYYVDKTDYIPKLEDYNAPILLLMK